MCIVAVVVLYRPLMLSSVAPEIAEARGINTRMMDLAFLMVLALVTTMAVPVVGSLLIFSLLIGPPAAARSFTSRPPVAIALSVVVRPRHRVGVHRHLLPDQPAHRVFRRRHQCPGVHGGPGVDGVDGPHGPDRPHGPHGPDRPRPGRPRRGPAAHQWEPRDPGRSEGAGMI